MNVSLTPELEDLVNEKVRSGFYQTASEVVREALRLLKQRDDEARRADQQAGLPPAGLAPVPAGQERGRKPRGRTRARVKR
jgi:antitoxin ParD1/3/4